MTRRAEGPTLMMNRLVIDTDEVPQRDRFDVWCDAFAGLHDVVAEPSCRTNFSAACMNLAVRGTVFGVYKTPARRLLRTSKHVSRDDIDHLSVRVSLSGEIRGRQRDQDYHSGRGAIGMYTYAYGYEEVHTAGHWVTVVVPRSSLPHFAVDRMPCVVSGVRASLLRDILMSFASSAAEASHEDMLVIEDVFRRVLESILLDRDIAVVDDLRLRRIDEVLRSEMGSSRLTVARVCELVGVSRTTLYRLFRDRGGMEMHLTGLRLDAIRQDLKAPARSACLIRQIAESRGMHNVSAFNRAFQRRFGCTPSDVRHGANVQRTRTLEREPRMADASGSFLHLLS